MPAAPVKAPPERKPEAPARKPAHLKRRIWQATGLAALLLFAAINAGIWWRAGDDHVSHDLWNGAGSIDIALDKFAQLHRRPHVVLLGSSLMMFPFWAVDRQADATVPDIFQHRRSQALSDWLAKNGASNNCVFSFAIFGQMVSDAYIYVNEFLKGDRAPDYLVFGVAPRDFHDNDLPAPTATYSFKRLVGLENMARYADLYLPSLQDKIDWLMGRLCYFYGHRWRLQHDFQRGLDRAFPDKARARAPHAAQAGFMLSGTEESRWTGSLAEYRRRYTNIGGHDVDVQMGFLDRLLELCRQRHIKVVLVNMPLTDVNRQLMPVGWYDAYRSRLRQLAAASGAEFIDDGCAPQFTHADFWDTTHLNHFGGHKLIADIERRLR